ncbi:MAG: TerB family tellurite resistance protein [Rhodobiaceae bacterium]|nr:TerB family tellurite resistance protein [Rhodobiaceae bacterium]MCC0012913.1 TerB family tellurite resistance protein [Rhodobiaceae bacterium]MCC0018966.1 TerB family tellurite resistance protein [Rhodobiaceae bacterium]MCC0051093.1 TerB family tellurite resistance protein [Rhodobiaceae bacterium]MCC0060060.1 TerB family tellurite resistance protein [Rhodobiaceae bacterium]
MDELKNLIDVWPIMEYRIPPGFAQEGDEGDAITEADGILDGEDDADPVAGMTLGISYRDAQGNESRRTIECHRAIESPDGMLIVAHCHLRDAVLAFPVSGITAITDYRTGETSKDPAMFFKALGISEDASASPTADLIVRTKPAVRILVHCANADGEFSPSERDVILTYIGESARQDPPIPDYSLNHIVNWLNALRPTEAQLRRDVEQIAGNRRQVERLTRAMSHLIIADGELSDEEVTEMRNLLDGIRKAAG